MQQSGLWGMVEQCREARQQLFAERLQAAAMTIARGHLELKAEALVAPEDGPVAVPGVVLGRRPDGVAALPSEPGGAAAMHHRQSLPGQPPATAGGAAQLQVFHHDVAQAVTAAGKQRARDLDGATVRQLIEGLGLGLEHVEQRGAVGFYEPGRGSVAEPEGVVDAAATGRAG